MEDLGSVCPFVQILDLPVPQVVENVTDTLRILDHPIAEQVEVPTVLSPARIALQIADTPVRRSRGERRVQGSLPGQSTTATHSSGKRISERIVEQIVDFTEQTVEQIVDIPSSNNGLQQGSSSSGFITLFPLEKSAKCRAGQCGPAPARQLMDSGGSARGCALAGLRRVDAPLEKGKRRRRRS